MVVDYLRVGVSVFETPTSPPSVVTFKTLPEAKKD